MENDAKLPMHSNPQYLHGQIKALQALVLTLAGITADPAEWREQGLLALEKLRVAMQPEPLSDTQLLAVDHAEDWLRAVTD